MQPKTRSYDFWNITASLPVIIQEENRQVVFRFFHTWD